MKTSASICKWLAVSLFAASVATGLTNAQPSNCTPKPTGLVSWWKAEGNGLDSISGNTAYAPLLQGGAGFAAGEVGQAFQLDNTNAFLIVPASSSLDVGAGSGLTMEGWIKVGSVSGLHPIAEWHGNTRTSTGVNFWLNTTPFQNGSLFASIIDTNETEHRLASAEGMVQPNVFQHVAVTYDKASGVGTLYLNGAIVAQSNFGTFVPATTADLWIAHRTLDVPGDWTYGATLGGLLDELSIYNRALGSNEIASIYNAGAAGKCDGVTSGVAPTITQQPTNQTVAAGGNATFTVTATGTAPLSYAWYGPASTLIAGATNSTLTLSNVQQANAGTYFVLVTNSFGSAQSSNAVLSVTGSGPVANLLVLPNYCLTNQIVAGDGSLNQALREQMVYAASQFPSNPIVITQIHWRPDANAGGPLSITISNLQIKLSTTVATPDHLSTIFAQNTGSNETVVFSGVTSVSSGFTTLSNGTKAFDISLTLQTPFLYDPSKGNLLVDLLNQYGCTPPRTPQFNIANGTGGIDAVSRVFSVNPNATNAEVADTGGDVLQIVYTNAPSSGTNSCTPAPSGIVAWWPGENNGNDVVGSNNAVLENAVTFAPGEVGQAFQLVDYTNGWMHVPASASLNVGAGGGFTVEGWIKVASVDGFHPIFEWHGATRYDAGVQLWLNSTPWESGALFASVVETNHNTHNLLSADGIVLPNVFQHVALTYDKASGLAKVYLNGTVVAQTTAGNIVPFTGADLNFGHRPLDVPGDWTYGTTLGGSLDEFAVYNRALGSNEIAAIYNAGSNGKCGVISGTAPVITQQPTNQTVAAGGSATFKATATGTAPLRYVWYGPANTLISGATNSTLTLSNVQQANSGTYFVLVTNSFGSAQSSNAVLAVTGGGLSNSGLIVPNSYATNQLVGADGTFNEVLKMQMVYSSTQFPASPITITELRWRPDQAVGQPFSITVSNLQVKLSTTAATVDHLSNIFAENRGTNETVVFSGVANLSSAFTTLSNGTTSFDIKLTLQTPFVYDATKGNLLVETRNLLGSSPARGNLVNGTTGQDAVSRVLTYDPNGTNAMVNDTGGDVLQIIYTNAPAGGGGNTNSCTPPPSGLVALWKGENNTLDSAGSNNGNVVGGSFAYSGGEVGNAFLYNNNNGYVTVPASPSLNVGQGPGFTLEAWIQPADLVNQMPIFEWQYNTNNNFNGPHFWVSSINGPGCLFANVVDSSNTSHWIYSSPGILTSNFQHVALTYDKASGLASIYRNGLLVASTNFGSFTPYTTGNLLLGERTYLGGQPTYHYVGALDEMSVYSRALGQSEIAAIYNAGAAGKCDGSNSGGAPALGLILPNYSISNQVFNPAGTLNQPLREQMVYGASQFPSNPIVITELRWRPDANVDGPLSVAISNLQVKLSTTVATPDHLSTIFTQNTGTNETLAFSGATSISTAFITLSNGTKAFDISLKLQTPFVYDPSKGNLLVDVLNLYGCTPPRTPQYNIVNCTGLNDAVSRVFSVNPTATNAETADTGGDVLQIIYTNAPIVVGAAPVITQQPTNQTVSAGGNATFKVTAIGTAPLRYVWYGPASTLIPGATNSTLTLSNVQQANAGTYFVLVTNSFGSAQSSNAVLSVTGGGGGGTNSCTPAPSGIVGWWPGEGNGNDVINGNSAVLESGVTFASGEVGQSFQLLNYTNGWMHVPASSNLDVGLGGGFTVEGWIKVASVDGFHPIFEWHGATRNDVGVTFWLNSSPYQSGAIFASVVETNHTTHNLISADGIVQANVFQHVALTYDKASGLALVYLNGTVVAQTTAGNIVPFTSGDLNFGHRPLDVLGDGTYNTILGGSIDEFAVYNRALGSNEIAAIYNAGSNGKCPPQIQSQAILSPQPVVNMSIAGKSMLLTWPLSAADFVLQSADGLTPPINWTNVPVTLQTNGDSIETTLPTDGGQGYFRLYHP